MRLPWYIWVGLFLALFGIALGIVFPVYIEVTDSAAFSPKVVVLYWVYPVLISLALALVIFAGTHFIFSGVLSKSWKWLLAKISLYTFSKALRLQNNPIQATGIGERNGSVVVRLEIGSNSGVAYGTRFRVTNTATGELWGIIEAVEVDDASCTGTVFDRKNIDFWDDLEQRMDRDPAPPLGITFTQDFPDEVLTFVAQLLNNWGGR